MRLRLRLSNGVSAAVEFSAHDGASLAVAAQHAYARYVREHGSPRAPLELHVAAPLGHDERGWDAPIRGLVPVVVHVSAVLLERRPPDDWTEIWDWCVAARRAGERLTQFLDEVVTDVSEEDEDD